jgi:hypothetical protein
LFPGKWLPTLSQAVLTVLPGKLAEADGILLTEQHWYLPLHDVFMPARGALQEPLWLAAGEQLLLAVGAA